MEEKIAIVDNTLCNLVYLIIIKFIKELIEFNRFNLKVTWVDGASLAQSLFSNLYLHDPNLIEDNYIKTFSISILKLIDWTRNKIVSASVYEEVNTIFIIYCLVLI